MDREGMLSVADQVLQAWNSHDVERVVACYTADAEYRDPNTRGAVRGSEPMRRSSDQTLHALADALGNARSASVRGRGGMRGPLARDVSAYGRRVDGRHRRHRLHRGARRLHRPQRGVLRAARSWRRCCNRASEPSRGGGMGWVGVEELQHLPAPPTPKRQQAPALPKRVDTPGGGRLTVAHAVRTISLPTIGAAVSRRSAAFAAPGRWAARTPGDRRRAVRCCRCARTTTSASPTIPSSSRRRCAAARAYGVGSGRLAPDLGLDARAPASSRTRLAAFKGTEAVPALHLRLSRQPRRRSAPGRRRATRCSATRSTTPA